MHTNISTAKCYACGDPVAPGEGVAVRVEGRARFVHHGCQYETQRHIDEDDQPDVDNFLGNMAYDRD